MRKLLIGILIVVLLVLAGYMVIDRINIGSLEILGIEAIVEKNDKLDAEILQATKLATVTYQSKLETLNSANKNLQQEKQEYENYVSAEDGTGAVSQIQSYEVEYLWTKIGNYAKREGVVLKMDVAVNNAVLGTYNLNFTVVGTYVGITEFIYDLDNDSSLLFKVENFKLLPNSEENTLNATFICKDISINIDSSSVSETNNNLNGFENINQGTENVQSSQTNEKTNNQEEKNTKTTE